MPVLGLLRGRHWALIALVALALSLGSQRAQATQIRQYCAVTTNVATVCSANPVVLLFIQANNGSAMAVTITCYDNSTAASGQVVFGPATMGANQVISVGMQGVNLVNGLTCIASGSPGGNGFLVVFTGQGGP